MIYVVPDPTSILLLGIMISCGMLAGVVQLILIFFGGDRSNENID